MDYDTLGYIPDCGCHKHHPHHHKAPHCPDECVCFLSAKLEKFLKKGYLTLKQALRIFATKEEFSEAVTKVTAYGTKPLNLSAEKEGGHKVIITGSVDEVTQESSGVMSSQDKINLDYLITNVNICFEHVQDVADIVTHED